MLERYSAIQDRQRNGNSGKAVIEAPAEGVSTTGNGGNPFYEQAPPNTRRQAPAKSVDARR